MTVDLTGGLGDEREFVFADSRTTRTCASRSTRGSGTMPAGRWACPGVGVEAVADQWETHDVQLNLTTTAGRNSTSSAPAPSTTPGIRREAADSGCGPTGLRTGRAVPALEDALRRPGHAVDGGRPDRRPPRATTPERPGADRHRHPIRRPPVGERRAPPRGRARARRAGRGRADGRAPLRAAVPGDRHRPHRGRGTRHSTVGRCGSAAKAFAGSGRSAATPGNPPSSRADGPSATSPTRRGRRIDHLQRGLPLRGRRRARPGVGRRGAVAAAPAAVTARTSRSSWRRQRARRASRARSVMSNFMVMGGVGSSPDFPVLQQAITRYTWDGESAHGMMERSTPGNQISASVSERSERREPGRRPHRQGEGRDRARRLRRRQLAGGTRGPRPLRR